MSESIKRKQVFQDYYTDNDYNEVILELPTIIEEAKKRASEVLEPTIYENREVMAVIKDYIRQKKRKVYGGTALNEMLKSSNPVDAIYNENSFSDIEFYSPTPVPDLVELTNLLYQKGYKYVVGKEAQHDETYSIFVNFKLYCDISYVPTIVYHGIKTVIIDGIHYADPHFMLIDYLRMINDPMNAAEQRWEKAFKRMYKLLKNYPLEYFDKQIRIDRPPEEIQKYILKIKNEFMLIDKVQESSLICGFEAYNFYIKYAADDRSVEKLARTTFGKDKLKDFLVNVPFFDLLSVNYVDTVERLYAFVQDMVPSPKDVTLDEYFPLFQFTNHMARISYKGIPLANVFEADGFCIPNVKTTKGYMYVSYQYLLMFMLISKFRSHLDKNKEMYFNYSIAISNLVSARNIYLSKKNLGVLNNSAFGEFRISCVGSTVSYTRMSQLRGLEKLRQGKSARFSYMPENFFKQSKESQERFDPTKHSFRNTSGNKIANPKNLMFKIDKEGKIRRDAEVEESFVSTDNEEKEPEEKFE